MKKFLFYSLSFLIAGALNCHAESKATPTATQHSSGLLAKRALTFGAQNQGAPKVKLHGFGKAAQAAEWNPTASMQAESWGTLYDENSNMWYFTESLVSDGSSWGGYIQSATITIYNNAHEVAGTISIDVPDSMKVNQITPYGTITKKFFDLNDKTEEVLVELHEVGNADNNYQGIYHTRAYHLDGTLATEFTGSGVFVNIVKNSWTKYQRLLISTSALEAVDGKTYSDGSQYYQTNDHIDIYKNVGWGQDKPQLEHSFVINEDLTYYSYDGTPLNIYYVDGSAYYVIAHYAKIWDSGEYTENGDPIPTADNSLVIKTYNDKMNLVDSLSIPVEQSEDTAFPMAMLGLFSDTKTVSKNFFTKDDNLAYVVSFYDYITAHDDYRYKFVAYDHEGNKLGTVCDGVYETWFDLASINGQEDQMVFLQYTTDETAQQMRVVNIPSMTEAAIVPAELDGIGTSNVLNRYGNGDDYKYIMKVRTGASDEQGNVLARIAWFNKDWSFDHFTEFNLGQSAENFALTLSGTYMNPYLFNTNDKLEFFYQAKMKDETSGKLDNVYVIADEDGNTLKTFKNSDELGTISTAGCFNANADSKELYLQYTDSITGKYNLQFYNLPISKFDNGGDGTVENPYLIATAGDLAAVADEPTASYKMVNDIDLSTYNNVNTTWKPISSFSGTFDGDNHNINNLYINSTKTSVGLFGDLGEKANIQNVVITKPEIELNSQNSSVGILAASTVSDTISNVHIYNATISGDDNAAPTIGGLVGQGTYYTEISAVSFNDGTIAASGASSVGGIAGDIRTSTCISAAAVNNASITAQSSVGGITGFGMSSKISNSHVNGTIAAQNTVGGIIGSDNATSSDNATTVDNCIFDGKVSAEKAKWNGYSAAGIVGSLAADWTSSTKKIISNNIVNGEICLPEGATNDKTVHRIIGRSIANEEDTTGPDKRLAGNVATSTTTVAGQTVTSTDSTSVEGADVTMESLNKQALEAMGYAYGTTVATPWKENGSSMPVLYFENAAKALVLSQNSVAMKVGDERTIIASAYGVTDPLINFESSNESIVEITTTESDDNKAAVTIKAKAEGTAAITFTLDNITATCNITVGTVDAIESATVNNGKLIILPGNGCLTAEGATQMNVYSISGQSVAKANGSAMSTAQMGKGTFIVVATDAKGNKATAKVVLK